MTEYEEIMYLRLARVLTRIRAWETLPDHPFREKMLAREQAILERLEKAKEAA